MRGLRETAARQTGQTGAGRSGGAGAAPVRQAATSATGVAACRPDCRRRGRPSQKPRLKTRREAKGLGTLLAAERELKVSDVDTAAARLRGGALSDGTRSTRRTECFVGRVATGGAWTAASVNTKRGDGYRSAPPCDKRKISAERGCAASSAKSQWFSFILEAGFSRIFSHVWNSTMSSLACMLIQLFCCFCAPAETAGGGGLQAHRRQPSPPVHEVGFASKV